MTRFDPLRLLMTTTSLQYVAMFSTSFNYLVASYTESQHKRQFARTGRIGNSYTQKANVSHLETCRTGHFH